MASWSNASSDPRVLFPYGMRFTQRAGRGLGTRFAIPMSQAFGFGGPAYDRLLGQIGSGALQGPAAQFVMQAQSVLPQHLPAMQALSGQLSGTANRLFGGYEQAVNAALGQLGQAMPAAQQITQAGQQALGTGIEYLRGQRPVEGLDYARRLAEHAFAPVTDQALFQAALQGAIDEMRPGMVARGMLEQGAASAAEADLARRFALDYAQGQFGRQQAATSLLSQIGALGPEIASALLGTGGQLAGTGVGMQSALAQLGPQLAGELMRAYPQIGEFMLGAQRLPFQAITDIQNFLYATQNPMYAYLQLLSPMLGMTSESRMKDIL